MNNVKKRFDKIQRDARALMAERRGVEVEKVEWPMGCFHDLRRTYATEMATHVDLLILCRWLGHCDPNTTQQYYHTVKVETQDRARQARADIFGAVQDTLRTHPAFVSADPASTVAKKPAARYDEAALSA